MPIIEMVSREEFEKHPGDPDYWVIPRNDVREGNSHPLYMRRSHKGLVIGVGEHNHYDDSDFYAVVWNPEKKRPEEIEYATTRAWTYPNHAEADATPEVQQAYVDYVKEVERKNALFKAHEEEHAVHKGKMVKVVRGRKVPIGTTGTVIWEGSTSYAPARGPRSPSWYQPEVQRVGIKTADGTVYWTAGTNVEVILPTKHEGLCDVCRRKAT